jgi:hypothetical protein
MSYGVQPTGFVRKSLNTVLLEIENAMRTEFGPDVIQTPQSPFGQINGLMADLITQLWETAEDVYQSYDIDQAEGTRLDGLATLRLMDRGSQETDMAFRGAITNQGRARVDVADLSRALKMLDGVEFVQVWVPGNSDTSTDILPPGYICVAIIGGDSHEIAEVMRQYVVPGISTYGNETVTAVVDGYCRSMLILRPILVPVELIVAVNSRRDIMGCPPPSLLAIRDALYIGLYNTLRNGDDITYYRVRQIIESAFASVEVKGFNGKRDNVWMGINSDVVIGFVELATIAQDKITVQLAQENIPVEVLPELELINPVMVEP